ncbi:membrane protein [Pseudomonas fluorescens]|uniref:Probable membrane transporter protein n=1 Tax=Pseudomonas fluorescens TaxID=294 RepID=A0A379I9G9_PSEFL|nr:membrane protein [Pseudomonas fluorescens]
MIIVLLLGLTVGVILALTGAGGGILAVPLLVFGVGLSMAEAGPIGLLAVGLASTLGAVIGLKNGTVRYKAALLIAGAGIVCSPLGLWLAQRTPNRPLTIMFAFVLMYVAFRVYQRSLTPSTESKTPGKL